MKSLHHWAFSITNDIEAICFRDARDHQVSGFLFFQISLELWLKREVDKKDLFINLVTDCFLSFFNCRHVFTLLKSSLLHKIQLKWFACMCEHKHMSMWNNILQIWTHLSFTFIEKYGIEKVNLEQFLACKLLHVLDHWNKNHFQCQCKQS